MDSRKAAEPLSFQAAVRLFRNPRETAATLIDRPLDQGEVRRGGAERTQLELRRRPRGHHRRGHLLSWITHVQSGQEGADRGSLERELHVW